MDRLLEEGLNIDLVDKVTSVFCYPIHHSYSFPSFHFLVVLHFEIYDWVMQDGLTALHQAIIGKKEAVISHLLRKGANLHAKDLVRFLFHVKNYNCKFVIYL